MNVLSATQPAQWFQPIAGDESISQQRILCTLCPRACKLKPGDKGFCFVRENQNGQMVLTTYSRSTGFCIDPIEKKPLNHFYPGTPVLSFGTAGCNLGCKFCQNWDISKSREVQRLSATATPVDVAEAALRTECTSVAFTYNDPVIWAEYAIDTAKECRKRDIKTVAVTAGYITQNAREAFFENFDAANVDLKAFSEDFYFSVTASHLQPVLDTLVYLKHETSIWFEITNLIIPDANDSTDELRRMCDWVYDKLGPDIPIHFSAFHPDYRMLDRPRTPAETLYQAYDLAKTAGIRFPYIGNIHDSTRQNTYCPNCRELLIQRDWYQLGTYRITDAKCPACSQSIPGHFNNQPGTWGPKRQPIDVSRCSPASTSPTTSSSSMSNRIQIQPSENNRIPSFSQEQRRALLALATETIFKCVTVSEGEIPTLKILYSDQLELFSKTDIQGVFVSLHKGAALRGCCGMLGSNFKLTDALQQSATRTALHDHRFPPVAESELAELTIDISILGPTSSVDLPAELRFQAIEIGKHGLRIRAGQQAGLLLPQVATEQGWNSHQFLQAVCRKAGLPLDAWKSPTVLLETFEGIDFGIPISEFSLDPLTRSSAVGSDLLTTAQLAQLTRWVQHNFAAVQTGATPLYYATDLPDADVSGLCISVEDQLTGKQFSATQFQTHPCLAMQSNLFQMVSALANRLPNTGAQSWRLSVAVLTNPRPLPTTATPESQPLDANRDAILARTNNGFVLAWDRNQPPDLLLKNTLSHTHFETNSPDLLLYRCLSLLDQQTVLSLPQASTEPSNSELMKQSHTLRSPAVAGRFYPADDIERNQMVARMISKAKAQYPFNINAENDDSTVPSQLYAIMTPHAGLIYSGAVAAAAWAQIEIPRDVIVIGPKHTPHGLPWAVAPHDHWAISETTSIPGNPELANLLVENIPLLQLDAKAHAAEHSIEVQLPFLHSLSPATRVTGLAIHGGSLEQIDDAAKQLKAIIRQLPERPLLVISSDMNHFASDSENRRRDALALEAFHSLDGRRLLETCKQNQISMCGVLPAALVLETVKLMAKQVECKSIAYATSADTSGQTDRVVGYAAAALFGQPN